VERLGIWSRTVQTWAHATPAQRTARVHLLRKGECVILSYVGLHVVIIKLILVGYIFSTLQIFLRLSNIRDSCRSWLYERSVSFAFQTMLLCLLYHICRRIPCT
jgi:hypothetical protein